MATDRPTDLAEQLEVLEEAIAPCDFCGCCGTRVYEFAHSGWRRKFRLCFACQQDVGSVVEVMLKNYKRLRRRPRGM